MVGQKEKGFARVKGSGDHERVLSKLGMNDAIVLYAVVDMPHSLSPSKWLRGLLKTARVSFLVR